MVEDASRVERTSAAVAVCRVTGEVEAGAAPVIRTAWANDPHTRLDLAALGPAAASLRDLAQTELTTSRRHTARPGGHGSHDIPKDEELLRRCRQVVTGG
ncbi:hypothetical protein [Streptomyces aurantiogriseus]|uniref:Uncharacterized protein n=1 Tax=Streptomyces aurantiogriseus TaxID=66870 RepID=A0A918L008_9ACTN|nr:hypothetical protein [Streptomyces aurantiogriseus]GGR60839.1 hypothetical protein GCM10010251_92020 [Streptomyces aurantiogriseus]